MERLKGVNKNDMTVKYIIGHWTANSYKPNATDLNSYQLLIDDKGAKHIGKAIGQAASTGGMNSITYNISCCGGLNRTPITKVQAEAFYKACAEKIKEYGLNISDFYTHAEIGEMCRNYKTKNAGESLAHADCAGELITKLLPWNNYLNQNISKVDLRNLPDIQGTAKQTGDFIRNKIKWYLQRL